MDINDQVEAAIHDYAETIPNAEFSLNLHAAAEHMAPELIKSLGLVQDWALVHTETLDDAEVIESVDCEYDAPAPVYDEINWRREMALKYPDRDYDDDEGHRVFVGSRLSTAWTEEHPVILDADEQRQMDVDRAPVA